VRIWQAFVLPSLLGIGVAALLGSGGAPGWAQLAVGGLVAATLAALVPLPPSPSWAVAVVDRDGAMEMAGTEVHGERFDAVMCAAFREGRRRYVVVQLRESGRTS
jgi:hypothetical protein